jgi:hypothetical protein
MIKHRRLPASKTLNADVSREGQSREKVRGKNDLLYPTQSTTMRRKLKGRVKTEPVESPIFA